MKREDYLFLTGFESNFKTVEESGYSRAISKADRKRIQEIIQEYTGKTFTENIHCSSCLVKLFQTVRPFFDEGITQEEKEEVKKDETKNRKAEKV